MMLHQAVLHPISLLRTPCRKLDRQAREAGTAPLACPLASTCSCLVRTPARLSRHVAACHSPQLLELAAAVAKEAHTQAVAKDTAGGSREPLLLCPCCIILDETGRLGLPRLPEDGYERHAGAPAVATVPPPGQAPGGMESAFGGGSSSSNGLHQLGGQAAAKTRQYGSWQELQAHISSQHEGQLVSLAAYIAGLGHGWEGAPCPLAVPSAEIHSHSHGSSRGAGGFGQYDLVACPGVGRFVFDSVEGLLEHCGGVHMAHMLQVGAKGVHMIHCAVNGWNK